jgi:hypothetical protein
VGDRKIPNATPASPASLVDDRMKGAALEATLRQCCEEALDRVEPRVRGRREVEGETQMAVEPGTHFGVLMDGVVVEDDVDGRAGRRLGIDGVEEADELLVAVALHVLADDGAVEHVEGSRRGG